MIKILALGAHTELKEIKPQLKKDDIELTTSPFSKVSIEIINNVVDIYINEIDVNSFDFVWINSSWGNRQLANAITLHLKHKKIAHTKVESEKSKLVDNVALANYGINIPNTFYAPSAKIKNSIESIERVCNYPVIIKVTRGSLGKDIFLATNRIELEKIIKEDLKKSKEYICQEFIENDFDYRIIVSETENILSAEKRIRKDGEFRNNAQLGAEEIFLNKETLTDELSEISIQSAKALNLDWTGIDVVHSTDNQKYYIIELNRRPGITEESSEITASYEYILSILAPKVICVEN